ncbi:Antitoxin RelJ [Streptomyces sp. RB5]|uniref:Antitoxin n=1 Tax=Streptomyces smaragdinus TaxID=2585196 RepID=A0A7K0CRL5_9ACTN|nr:Antitoxin RelJ [Streptomyces smaragdinus]
MRITADEARRNLVPLIKRVIDDHDTIEITSEHGNVVMMSAEDFAAWQEEVYLLRSR